MTEERKLIGEYLLKKGIITEAQLKEAVKEVERTNRKIGEILVRRGFAKEEDIAHALSEQLGFTFVDLSTYQIESEAIALIPKESALKLSVIPIFKVGNSLSVAMTNPLDVAGIDELGYLSGGLRIKPLLATPTGIKEAIAKFYGVGGGGTENGERILYPETHIPKPEGEPSKLIQEASQAPVIKLVNQLIEEAVKSGASDIHLEPQEDGFYCRLRVDGVLHETEPPPKELQLAVISRIKIMAEMDIAQSRLPQDGRIQTKALDRDIDLRVATFPTIYGEHVSIRVLDKTQGIIKLEELGFQEDTLKKFKEIIYKPYGIILVTGPTGSGKTTSLYAVLNTINDLKKNIITLEDPVEYTIARIHQSQVNVRAGLTFATGLRSIVRLDPDIIMIGEIRDKETADIAIHSSLTGHLVFSTLHTNDAPSCATRLVDIGVEPYLVASSLAGVLAQRLVRRLCPKCKKEYKPTEEELSVIGERLAVSRRTPNTENRTPLLYQPTGCKDCHNTGYKGRTGIFELLIPDNGIKELIIKKAPAHQIRDFACKQGMKTLRQDGFQKVLQGITSLSEVLSVTEEV
jgi:type IV pilus assembly protein PilB